MINLTIKLKDVAVTIAFAILIPLTIFQLPHVVIKYQKNMYQKDPAYKSLKLDLAQLEQDLDYQKTTERFAKTKQEAEAEFQKRKELSLATKKTSQDLKALRQQLIEKQEKPYTTVQFYLMLVLGLFALVAGFFINGAGLAAGTMLGGAITLLIGHLIGLNTISPFIQASVLLLSLALLFVLSYRLYRNN